MTLLEAIKSESAVAVSRLADESVYAAIVASKVELIEVPHLAGRPLDDSLSRGVTRVRHWPNIAGYLESGSDNDIVVWSPSLAPAPTARVVVQIGRAVSKTNDRTVFLGKLMKRLERHRGVVRVCTPATPRGIIYTRGVEVPHIDRLAERYPDAVETTPARLSEFPGGLCLAVTPEAWEDPNAFAQAVDTLIGETDAETTPIDVI